jgi:hypothetical protein
MLLSRTLSKNHYVTRLFIVKYLKKRKTERGWLRFFFFGLFESRRRGPQVLTEGSKGLKKNQGSRYARKYDNTLLWSLITLPQKGMHPKYQTAPGILANRSHNAIRGRFTSFSMRDTDQGCLAAKALGTIWMYLGLSTSGI